MNPDGSLDVFGLALHGDAAGNVWQHRDEGGDLLLFSADVPGVRTINVGSLSRNGRPITDLLKFSGVCRLAVVADVLDGTGCTEDAIDVNNLCRDLSIAVFNLYPANLRCGTIKGGSVNVSIAVTCQHGHGSETDWDYGNFSDQSNARTTGSSLSTRTADGTPAKVRLLTADRPKLLNEKQQRFDVLDLNQGWFYPVYNFLKDVLKTFHVGI